MIEYSCDVCSRPVEARARLELAVRCGKAQVGRSVAHICPTCAPAVVKALGPSGNGKGKPRTPKD
jgi:hypothetical protein